MIINIEKAISILRVESFKANIRPTTTKVKNYKESISLKKLKKRYQIALKFNYKISLTDLFLVEDVQEFIKNNNLKISKTKEYLVI